MNSVQVRIPLRLGHRLQGILSAEGAHEHVAFCLISNVSVDRTQVLLVRDVWELPGDAYLDDATHGAAWRGAAMIPIIEAAMQQGLGVLLVHAHHFSRRPRLSEDDVRGARRLLPMLQARVPGRPHGSIVLGQTGAAGLVALPGKAAADTEVGVCWMGKSMVEWPLYEPSVEPVHADDEFFDRQGLIVGEQGFLRRTTVAVVGLGGGGSHVVQQLAHVGVGTIVGIDRDQCDSKNLHRTVGMRRGDDVRGVSKLLVMSRLVRALGTGARFVGVNARVPEPDAMAALARATLIVGCVDNLHARADIQEFAWRRIIPYVDIGVSIRAVEGGILDPRVTVGGNVHVLIPGGFCMWCCGYLSEEKLVAEAGGKPRTYFENKGGQAQVVSFNGAVASQAVTEVIQLLTGFRGTSIDPHDLVLHDGSQRGFLKLDGLRGTIEEWGASRRPDCPCCCGLLGAGTVLWKAAS